MTYSNQLKYYNKRLKGNGFTYNKKQGSYYGFGTTIITNSSLLCKIIFKDGSSTKYSVNTIQELIEKGSWELIKNKKSINLYKQILKL